MHKFFSAAICFAALACHCSGQTTEASEKKYNHYIGFQANELLRQLFNLSNSSTDVNNPYMLIYSINETKSGWGLHMGLGWDYNKIVDADAPVSRETKKNDSFFRLGIEKKFPLGKKFEGGFAFDLIGSYLFDKTISLSVTNTGSTIDSTETTVTTKTNSWGFGPQGSIGFHISEKVILGTEASLYFTSQSTKENVLNINTETQIFNNETTVTSSNSNLSTDTQNFTINIPVALFLIVKF